MKAIRVVQFGGPEVMQLKNVPDPTPGPNQVLIRVRAAGVNPVDTYRRAGKYPNVTLPFTPGSDAAGELEAAGALARQIKTGARVYTSGSVTGTYASLTICEAGDVHPLPERVSFAEGAALNVPYATAWRALFQRGRAVPGETVLVHGASGGVGTAAVQLGRAAGLRVIGTAGSDEGAQMVRELGASEVLDHRRPDYLSGLGALTEGRGVDIILEMLANVNLGKDLALLAMGGRGDSHRQPRAGGDRRAGRNGEGGGDPGGVLGQRQRAGEDSDPRGVAGGVGERHGQAGHRAGIAAGGGGARA